MQVICTLALHHTLTDVSHEVTYVEQMQHSSLFCFAVGHTSSSMSENTQHKPVNFRPLLSAQFHIQLVLDFIL